MAASTALGPAASRRLLALIKERLAASVGEADDVLPEYVLVMLRNGKTQQQVSQELEAFIEGEATPFAAWLWEVRGAMEEREQEQETTDNRRRGASSSVYEPPPRRHDQQRHEQRHSPRGGSGGHERARGGRGGGGRDGGRDASRDASRDPPSLRHMSAAEAHSAFSAGATDSAATRS